MPPPRPCVCGAPATHYPVLELRREPNGATADVVFPIALCGEHVQLVTVDALLARRPWLHILGDFTSRGLPVPRRNLTTVRHKSIDAIRSAIDEAPPELVFIQQMPRVGKPKQEP